MPRWHLAAVLLLSIQYKCLCLNFSKASFLTQGYAVLKGVLAEEDVDLFAATLATYLEAPRLLWRGLGKQWSIADFMRDDALRPMYQRISGDSSLRGVLEEILGHDYLFFGHNDIAINAKIGWHTDRLNGVYRNFEAESRQDPWSLLEDGSRYNIVKVVTYLEDHAEGKDLNALTVVPGSHLLSTCLSWGDDVLEAAALTLHPRKGDMVIFDQRLSHRGAKHGTWPGRYKYRFLVTLGFGANNQFTADFANGTRHRQNEWNNPDCSYNAYSKCSVQKICGLLPPERALNSPDCLELAREGRGMVMLLLCLLTCFYFAWRWRAKLRPTVQSMMKPLNASV